MTWTKGIDPKTGKPVDYDPTRDVQLYAGIGTLRGKPGQEACPWWSGSPTFFPPTFDAKRMIAFVAGGEGCTTGYVIKTPMDETKDWVGQRMCCQENGRVTAHGALWALDVRTGKVIAKAQFPIANESGMLSTGGDLLFTGHNNGRLAAYDADTLKEYGLRLGTPITAAMTTASAASSHRSRGGGAPRSGRRPLPTLTIVAVFGL